MTYDYHEQRRKRQRLLYAIEELEATIELLKLTLEELEKPKTISL
jgi:hypothetical protein